MINPLRRYLQWLFFSMFMMISWFSLCSCEQEIYSLLEETKEEYIFQVYPSMACFPGGTSKLIEFLGENIKYPAASELEGIQGRVRYPYLQRPKGSGSRRRKRCDGCRTYCSQTGCRGTHRIQKKRRGTSRQSRGSTSCQRGRHNLRSAHQSC